MTEPCATSGAVHSMNFPVFMVDQLVKNLSSMKETPVRFLAREDPLEKGRRDRLPTPVFLGFPGGSAGKESDCNTGDLGLIPELGRSPGEGNGHPLQYSGLETSMNFIVHGVAKSRTRLSHFHFHLMSRKFTGSLDKLVRGCVGTLKSWLSF